jgi:hypothetical protein
MRIGSSMARARQCRLTRCWGSCVTAWSVAASPLWRVAVFVRPLHPHIMGRRFVWRPDVDVEVRDGPFDVLETAGFRNSPFAQVCAAGSRFGGALQTLFAPSILQCSRISARRFKIKASVNRFTPPCRMPIVKSTRMDNRQVFDKGQENPMAEQISEPTIVPINSAVAGL